MRSAITNKQIRGDTDETRIHRIKTIESIIVFICIALLVIIAITTWMRQTRRAM